MRLGFVCQSTAVKGGLVEMYVALACMADFIEVARLFKWETNVSCVNLTKLMGNLVTILTAFGTLSLCCDQ